MAAETTSPLFMRTPFVGRENESARLRSKLEEARAGRGGLVMLVGEPGIGKTRTAEEFAECARHEGATVLGGRCYEGDWAPPYGPFAEALAEYVRDADPDALRQDLGYGGPPIARLVPALRDKLSGIEEQAPLQPDEERFRLLDAVSQLLIAVSQRAPIVLVLDDLHWADKGTIAMLRHVARFAKQNRILLVGAYRDVELDREHPLAVALGQLRGETVLESLPFAGLEGNEVGALVSMVAEQALSDDFVSAISRETAGNPFFIREVLLHLVDAGALYQLQDHWKGDAALIQEIGLPGGVREAVERRLSRLSDNARSLLTAASAFDASFPFGVACATAQLAEPSALDALDEALAAQILQPGAAPEAYEFTHSLVRHTLYSGLSSSRQVRLHRNVAEAMAEAHDSSEHAAEIAYHYHRSATLPGAERGVEYAITAAGRAQDVYAHEGAATLLRMALELMAHEDARRARVMGRLATALVWNFAFEDAVTHASGAADLIAEQEGYDAAADYLANVVTALYSAGDQSGAWTLSDQGLQYIRARHDVAWAIFSNMILRRDEAADRDNPGIPLDVPERHEIDAVACKLALDYRQGFVACFSSRREILTRFEAVPASAANYSGDYRRALVLYKQDADRAETEGRLASAAADWAQVARLNNALGYSDAAESAYDRALSLSRRLAGPSFQALQIAVAGWEMSNSLGHLEEMLPAIEALLNAGDPQTQWASAAMRAGAAWILATLEREEEALRLLATLPSAIERAPLWAPNYVSLVCLAAATLWALRRTDFIDIIERNLHEKVIVPDLRFPGQDGRHAMAQLCALRGRHDEANVWWKEARHVLDEQGARPLRAGVDYDEALMYVRRGRRGDRVRALPLVEAALAQFREIGMTGWVRRAEGLRRSIEEKTAGVTIHPDGITSREVDVLRLIAAGRTNNEIAGDLTLSVRTVARHITHIYAKIGARNKVEATDYAHLHGLK